MSPISPFLMGGGRNNWPGVQIPDFREKCPKCGNILNDVHGGTIGGFPGHELIHPSSVVGYRCSKCNRYFPLEEFLRLKEELKEKKAREEVLVENYWKDIRDSFKNPYLCLIVVCFMLLYGFWAGITAGIVIPFLMPILAQGLEIVFAPLGRLIRKKFGSPSPNKPPDSPQAP